MPMLSGAGLAEWANMVGPFGGITAAVLLRAIESHPDRLGEPVALTVNFAAPIVDGEFEISRRAPRTNRTNQHWIVRTQSGWRGQDDGHGGVRDPPRHLV